MAHAFFLGVDAADESESKDGVVLTLIEKEKAPADDEAAYRLDRVRHYTDEPSADDLANRIQSLVAERPYIGRTSVIVNREKDFGEALVEALEDRGMAPVAATYTSGTGATAGGTDEVGVHLGTIDAVRVLAGLYRDGRFTVEGDPTESASRLVREMQGLSEALDVEEGNQNTPNASTGGLQQLEPFDLFVTSAALAAWLGTERSFDPSKHLKEDPQTDGGRSGGAQ